MAASSGAAPAITPDSATNPPAFLPSPPFTLRGREWVLPSPRFTQQGQGARCHHSVLRNRQRPSIAATRIHATRTSQPAHPRAQKSRAPKRERGFPGRKAGRQRAPTGYTRDARGFLPPPAATRGTSREPGPWWCRRPGPRPRSCRRRWRPYGRRSRPGSPSCARR